MNRRCFLRLSAAQAASGPLRLSAAGRPHVVIFLADDLGWADVGYHGSEIRTPNIDRLAREGTQLDRFYSFPVCSPTRSALMTGRSPMRLGLGYTVIRPWSDYGLPLEEHTIAQSFAAAGYETAMAGKWHLGHGSRKYFPGSRGFQHSYGHFNGAIDYYTHQREGGLDWHRNGQPLNEQGYSTDLIGQEAVRRIRNRDRNKPLFLYVPFNAPHSPLQAPRELVAQYAFIQDEKRRVFAAMVERMDAAVGKVLEALDQERIGNDTIVLIFSDNGGPTNQGARNTPLRGAKASTFEGGIRVPAVIRWPGRIGAGKVSPQLMTAWDVFPTLAAAAQVPPQNKLPFDGKNLWPVIEGKQPPVAREDLFFSVENGNVTHFAVFSGSWKLVRQIQPDQSAKNMLFRIFEDPQETRDLSSSNPAVVEELTAKLVRWRQLHPSNGERFSAQAPANWKAPRQWAAARN